MFCVNDQVSTVESFRDKKNTEGFSAWLIHPIKKLTFFQVFFDSKQFFLSR